MHARLVRRFIQRITTAPSFVSFPCVAPDGRGGRNGISRGLAGLLVGIALLAVTVRAPAQMDPPPSGIAITRDPNPPMLPLEPATRLPIFFPPLPPMLGATESPTVIDLRFPAPPEPAAFVNERFYPALSTLYAEQRLTPTLATRLADYLVQRRAAEAKLESRLDTCATLRGPERRQALAGFAREQESALAQLEASADQLRRDFIAAGTDWNKMRLAKIESFRKRVSADAYRQLQSNALLAAATYTDDLPVLVRELLIEAAIEALPANPPGLPVITSDRRAMFFLPAGTRIAVPHMLPESLTAQIAGFEELKAGLKRQFIETVWRTDLASERSAKKSWQAVLAAQAKNLAALERDGEVLRVVLLEARVSVAPALKPAFPAEFTERFRRFREQLRGILRERDARLAAAHRELLVYKPHADAKRFEVVTEPILYGNTLEAIGYIHRYVILDRPGATPEAKAVVARLREIEDTFRRDAADQLRALTQEEAALTAEAGRLAGPPSDKTPAEIFRAFVALSNQADEWPRYVRYWSAVMQPGLSAAQRRLLLGVALERLALPLPGGELQPKDGVY